MKKIAILTWWTGWEREIALKSAKFFEDNLKREYDLYILPEDINTFIQKKDLYSLAIPIFHWEYWEDGKIFAFCEILWIKTVFSPYDVHALCLDKFKTNVLLKELWVNIPKQYIYSWALEIDTYSQIVKPNHWWSSLLTFKVNNKEELKKAIEEITANSDDDILVQEFISWDEISVPVLNWKVLPIMSLEKINPSAFFDYKSKYESEDTIKEVFWKVSWKLEEDVGDISSKIFKFLWCKWVSRIDFIVNWNWIFFIEINTIPWMTKASILPKSWRYMWNTDIDLVNEIILKYL